ncbi:interleukin-18 [Anolis carolinensis]|uniref:Interleukin 18 n=1 Tax=Anolis carolinensis TaxID=28377 RepID=H9GM92_ANOCA|nr:PREDICTED: interleukin-18 [Anolis carolinensis]XP_016854185.1 PREDICTED: interleukin-18 [Anolis carolinensis]|eukprot:XP_003229579.1 PREDICTED: interleukin-18 [Anolis carolinensis]
MTSDLVPMNPMAFCDGILIFAEDQEDKDLECDSWKNSGKCERTQILRNRDNYVLLAQPDDHEDYRAVFQFMTDQEMQNASGIKFNIHSYEDSRPRGLSVAFTIEWNRKTYYMCVAKRNSQMKVEFKEGDVPKRIPGQTSNVIFYKMSFSEGGSQFYRFETALERGHYLAFERDGNNTTRLIIKKATDEVDQTTEIYHASFP